MEEQVLLDLLNVLGKIACAILIPLATIILGKRLIQDRKSTGQWNYIRLIIFVNFLCFSIFSIIDYFFSVSPLSSQYLYDTFYREGFGGLKNFLIGVMVSIGLTLVFYINRREALYYLSFYFYGGMCVFYLLTGFDGWLDIYIKVVGVISIVFLYFTSIKVRDDGGLGLAIFFTLSFSVILIEILLIKRILVFSYVVFIVFFSLGYFKPFKQEVKSND